MSAALTTLEKVTRKQVVDYVSRWDVVVCSNEFAFLAEADRAAVSAGPFPARIDLYNGLIYAPLRSSPVLVLHELGHLLLSRWLGSPERHDEYGMLASFEYFSVQHLGWPLPVWKAWRTRSGGPRDGADSNFSALKEENVKALCKTGLFRRLTAKRLEPTFLGFRPHPRLRQHLEAAEKWTKGW